MKKNYHKVQENATNKLQELNLKLAAYSLASAFPHASDANSGGTSGFSLADLRDIQKYCEPEFGWCKLHLDL